MTSKQSHTLVAKPPLPQLTRNESSLSMAITEQNQLIGQTLGSIKEFERANQPLKTESREVSHRHIRNALTRNYSNMQLM